MCHECEVELHRAWLPEHDAQVAVKTLREAAGSIDGPDWAGYEYAAADWLNARADLIERGEAT